MGCDLNVIEKQILKYKMTNLRAKIKLRTCTCVIITEYKKKHIIK